MPWVYLDDQFPDHPKVVYAGPAAAWLFVCGLAYCKRYNTSGKIPYEQVTSLSRQRDSRRLVSRLTRVPPGFEHGLWEDHGEYYLVHDYEEWNKAQMSRSEAGRKAAKARWDDAKRNANASESHMRQDALSPPYPSVSTFSGSSTPSDTASHGGDFVETAVNLAAQRYAEHQVAKNGGRSADGLAKWWLQENAVGARQRAAKVVAEYDVTTTQLADVLSQATPPQWLRHHRRHVEAS